MKTPKMMTMNQNRSHHHSEAAIATAIAATTDNSNATNTCSSNVKTEKKGRRAVGFADNVTVTLYSPVEKRNRPRVWWSTIELTSFRNKCHASGRALSNDRLRQKLFSQRPEFCSRGLEQFCASSTCCIPDVKIQRRAAMRTVLLQQANFRMEGCPVSEIQIAYKYSRVCRFSKNLARKRGLEDEAAVRCDHDLQVHQQDNIRRNKCSKRSIVVATSRQSHGRLLRSPIPLLAVSVI
jgi:hypothetical protein